MVIRPWHSFVAQPLCNVFGHLGAEAQVVDGVRKGVTWGPLWNIQIICKIMHMHLTITEAAARRNMEVANDLVDSEAAHDAAALMALLVQFLRIVLTLALFDIFTSTKRPRDACIGFADFFASLAAALLDSGGRGRGTVAIAAVVGIQVGGLFISMSTQSLDFGSTNRRR